MPSNFEIAVVPTTAIETSVRLVTPAQADFWLTHCNTKNRTLRVTVVRKYARDMEAGRWLLTPESIMFDPEGNLLNGQHRLKAVIESGATVPFTISTNVDPEVFKVLDSGVKRTAGDALASKGRQSVHKRAAVARSLLLWDISPDDTWSSWGSIITPAEVLEFEEANQERVAAAMDYYPASSEMRGNRLTSTQVASFADRVLRHSATPELLPQFIEGMIGNVGLYHQDPRLAARNFDARSKGIRNSNLVNQATATILVRAWNAWLKNEQVRSLYFKNGQPLPMPEPR